MSLPIFLTLVSDCHGITCQSDPTTEFNKAVEVLVKDNDQTAFLRLFENGLNVNYQNSCGASILHVSTIMGSESLVTLLLSKGADPNVSNWQGETPAYMAAQWAEDDILIKLLRAGASPNDFAGEFEFNPLMIAVLNKHYSTVEILVAYGAEPNLENDRGVSAISIARESSDIKLIAILEAKVP